MDLNAFKHVFFFFIVYQQRKGDDEGRSESKGGGDRVMRMKLGHCSFIHLSLYSGLAFVL